MWAFVLGVLEKLSLAFINKGVWCSRDRHELRSECGVGGPI